MARYNRRRNYYGGNSGYVGYSMSVRAAEAREDGKYPKGDFCKEYKVSPAALNALVEARLIDDTEWHHTSMYGNCTTFYAWVNDWARECGMCACKRTVNAAIDRYFDEKAEKAWYEEQERINEELRKQREAESARIRAKYEERVRMYELKLNAMPLRVVLPIITDDTNELFCYVEIVRNGRYWHFTTIDTQKNGVREGKSYGWIKAKAQMYIDKNYPMPVKP